MWVYVCWHVGLCMLSCVCIKAAVLGLQSTTFYGQNGVFLKICFSKSSLHLEIIETNSKFYQSCGPRSSALLLGEWPKYFWSLDKHPSSETKSWHETLANNSRYLQNPEAVYTSWIYPSIWIMGMLTWDPLLAYEAVCHNSMC